MNLVSPIASVIDDTIKKKVMAQIIAVLGLASIPFLGPILTAVISWALDLLLTYLLTKTIIGGARLWVIANVDWQVDNVEKTTKQLQELLDNPEKFTSEEQAQIEKDFDAAAVKLIHITNARVTI